MKSALFDYGVEVEQLDAELDRRIVVGCHVGVVADHVHPEGGSPAGHPARDLTHSHEPQSLTVNLRSRLKRFAIPTTRLDVLARRR